MCVCVYTFRANEDEEEEGGGGGGREEARASYERDKSGRLLHKRMVRRKRKKAVGLASCSRCCFPHPITPTPHSPTFQTFASICLLPIQQHMRVAHVRTCFCIQIDAHIHSLEWMDDLSCLFLNKPAALPVGCYPLEETFTRE